MLTDIDLAILQSVQQQRLGGLLSKGLLFLKMCFLNTPSLSFILPFYQKLPLMHTCAQWIKEAESEFNLFLLSVILD